LVAANPFRERLNGQLMLALYREGRQVEALHLYQRVRRDLRNELGLEPGPALQQWQRSILRHEPSLGAASVTPERSILVALRDADRLEDLLALAKSLARRPSRELILARLIPPGTDVTATASLLNDRRQALMDDGIAARTVAFTSAAPAEDPVRRASWQTVDLVVVGGAALEPVFAHAPCDVAMLEARETGDGPIVVLFGAGEHDWAAVEVGAWIARSRDVPLRLAGPAHVGERDSSRTLASASLAVQRVLGIAAEPLLVAPGVRDVLAAVDGAGGVVVGLPARWSEDGLGHVRSALVEAAAAPVLLVQRGLRPGGLSPRESLTRFTWTLAPAH